MSFIGIKNKSIYMKKIDYCFLSFAMMVGFASTAIAQEPLWKNEDAPIAERVEDLLGRMTVDEKIDLLRATSPAN